MTELGSARHPRSRLSTRRPRWRPARAATVGAPPAGADMALGGVAVPRTTPAVARATASSGVDLRRMGRGWHMSGAAVRVTDWVVFGETNLVRRRQSDARR